MRGKTAIKALPLLETAFLQGRINVLKLRIEEEFLSVAREFFAYIGKRQGVIYLRVVFEIWYEHRTLKQNNIFHSIVRQIADATDMDMDLVKQGIKEVAVDAFDYPVIEINTSQGKKRKPLPSRRANTRQMSILIFAAFTEAAYQRVDVREEFFTYEEWIKKKNQNKDPLESTFVSEEDYTNKHPYCEACLGWLGYIELDENGIRRHEGQLIHIVSAGASAIDDLWNRMRFCTRCHLMIQHQYGWPEFLERYPIVERRVINALKRFNEVRRGEVVTLESARKVS